MSNQQRSNNLRGIIFKFNNIDDKFGQDMSSMLIKINKSKPIELNSLKHRGNIEHSRAIAGQHIWKNNDFTITKRN